LRSGKLNSLLRLPLSITQKNLSITQEKNTFGFLFDSERSVSDVKNCFGHRACTNIHKISSSAERQCALGSAEMAKAMRARLSSNAGPAWTDSDETAQLKAVRSLIV
jgi:hypothetical protein